MFNKRVFDSNWRRWEGEVGGGGGNRVRWEGEVGIG